MGCTILFSCGLFEKLCNLCLISYIDTLKITHTLVFSILIDLSTFLFIDSEVIAVLSQREATSLLDKTLQINYSSLGAVKRLNPATEENM